MIPKKIHYIWFGSAPYPEKVQNCIKSWHKHLPEYEFKLWNEDNFDINCCAFVREAYHAKQWAFVSDYVRIFALAKEGGIYLDTDIEILKPLHDFLHDRVVLGTDDGGSLTAFMASEPEHPYFSKLLQIYHNRNFLLSSGRLNMEVNNKVLERELALYGFVQENKEQFLENGIHIYPDDYFHVVSLLSGKIHRTRHSAAIHWHTLLWISKWTRFVRFLRLYILVPIIGAGHYSSISKLIKRLVNYGK